MKVFCTSRFKTEMDGLKGKKQYKEVEEDTIDYFLNKTIDEVSSGTRLNNSETTPYIKKRLEGSGGFRVYYLLIIKDDNAYLMFIHPKTGSMGGSNITDEAKKTFYKDVLIAIQKSDLYEVSKHPTKSELVYAPMLKAVIAKSGKASK